MKSFNHTKIRGTARACERADSLFRPGCPKGRGKAASLAPVTVGTAGLGDVQFRLANLCKSHVLSTSNLWKYVAATLARPAVAATMLWLKKLSFERALGQGRTSKRGTGPDHIGAGESRFLFFCVCARRLLYAERGSLCPENRLLQPLLAGLLPLSARHPPRSHKRGGAAA